MDVLRTVAGAVAKAFPDLDGRVMVVTEAQINRERVPRLPACLIALINETPDGRSAINTASQNKLREVFVIDFWLPPKAYDAAGNEIDAKAIGDQPTETVYFAYYPYDKIRNALLNAISDLQTDQRGRLYYEKLEISGDKFAVTLTFTFSHAWNWCASPPTPAEIETAKATRIVFKGLSPGENT
jgi:hypothetical protein